MGLKQIREDKRIIFLKRFSAEILLNLSEKYRIKTRIDSEKIKQKFIEPNMSADEAIKKVITSPVFKTTKEIRTSKSFERSLMNKDNSVEETRKPMIHRIMIPKPRYMIRPTRNISPQIKPQTKTIIKNTTPKNINNIPAILEIKPEIQPRPQGFALGKIEAFIRDPSIQMIECPGPAKPVLVKRYNNINITQVALNQNEISTIIDNFSKQAKIPQIGGIFKAAVGDLVISAITSEFVGSRFIINKITPYSMIE